MKEVKFDFPTAYEATDVEGDMLWNALMPRMWTSSPLSHSPPKPPRLESKTDD